MIDLRKHIRLLPPQENIKCCTASATLTAAELIMAVNGVSINFSRLFLYYMTRRHQGRIDQHGASLSATFEALKIHGCCTDRRWPFIPIRVNKQPDHVSVAEAANFKIEDYRALQTTDFNQFLEQGIPVVIGMRIGRKFLKLQGPIDTQRYVPVNSDDNRYAFGHAVTIVGFDDSLNGGSWIVANSMGPRWGDLGYAAIPYACEVDIGEAYIINSFSGFSIDKKFSTIDK